MQLKYMTSLPVEFFYRDPSSDDATWQFKDFGPGVLGYEPTHQLCVRMRNIDDGILKTFVTESLSLTQLFYLNLSENRKITDKGCIDIAKLAQLSVLNLSSCDLSNNGLQTLGSMRSLTHLDLSFCNRITDAGVLNLRSLTNLGFLDLHGLPKISNGSLSKIRRKGLQIRR